MEQTNLGLSQMFYRATFPEGGNGAEPSHLLLFKEVAGTAAGAL